MSHETVAYFGKTRYAQKLTFGHTGDYVNVFNQPNIQKQSKIQIDPS